MSILSVLFAAFALPGGAAAADELPAAEEVLTKMEHVLLTVSRVLYLLSNRMQTIIPSYINKNRLIHSFNCYFS